MPLSESVDDLPDSALRAGFVPREEEETVARHLLRPCFAPDRESARLLAFDDFDRLVAAEEAWGGGNSLCDLSPQHWRKMALANVAGVLMAHNHPSGAPWPSPADFAATREAAHLLRLLGIELIDHLIFVGQGHFSFRRAGLL